MFTLYELAMGSMLNDDDLYISAVYDIPEIKLRKCCQTTVRHIVYGAYTVSIHDVMPAFLKYGCQPYKNVNRL